DIHEAFTWVRHGRRDKLAQFCKHGFDVDMRNDFGHSLAMVAAQNNQKGVLKVLHRFGVSINDQDYRGNTALHYATQYGYTVLGEYMIKKLGADEAVVN
ncbi:ankyrin repeat-containing domain protein, partial [Pelagophyceae sp. CCMP2097]